MHFPGRSLTLKVLVTIAAVTVFQVAPYKAMATTVTYGVSATAGAQTFATTFVDSDGFDGNVLLDTELWDANRNRVFQYFETRKSYNTSETITQPITAGLPNGTYTIKGGIFAPNWAKQYTWSEQAGTIVINNGVVANSYDATSTLNGTSFDTAFTSTQPMSGQYLLDVELYDSSNKRVYQYFDNYTINGTAVTMSRQLPSTIAAGTYTARAGIFMPGWTTKLLWDNNAGSIVVGSPAAPTTYSAVATGKSDGTFETTFTSSRNVTGQYLFDVELYNSQNKRVYQSFDNYSLDNSNSMTIARAIPSNLAAGKYTIKSGWFTPQWATSLLWSENTGSLSVGTQSQPVVTVVASAPTTTVAPTTTTTVAPTTTTTVAPTTTSTTAAPTTTTTAVIIPPQQSQVLPAPLTFTAKAVATGSNFDTTFTASRNVTEKLMYDVELYNSQNNKSYQYFEVRDGNNNNQATVSALIPTNIPAGTYTVKSGVFSPDWSTKYLWSENSGTVKVGSNPTAITNSNGPAGATGNWNMVFGDEFNGASLDTTKWTTCSRQLIWWKNTCMGHGSEQQAYTNDNVNIVDFGDGNRGLRLTARKAGTWSFSHDDVPAGTTRYDSGMISTSPDTMGFNQNGYKPFDFKYGFYEVRMRAPKGQGYWPAAWAFPTDNVGPQELDLVEILGNDTNTAYQTVHYPGGQSSIGNSSVDTADGFHTYGMDWQPGYVAWYIDGKLARTQFTKAGSVPDKNMYLMLNFAVGGVWPGAADGSTPNVANMDVDWVHVWQKA